MEPKTIQGFVLIDAPYSALNNAGLGPSERTDNIVKTKVIWKDGEAYPYVSGQAWRYWWRDTLEKKMHWKLSPVSRAAKIAYTAADPFTYKDDDLFGYMRAEKGGKKTTLTRVSVLKNSPLISVFPQRPTDDFGTFSRFEGDPVPYEHQFYSTILKGIFSIDLNLAGVFLKKKRAGQQNITDETQIPKNCIEKDGAVWLPKEERTQRVKEVLEALPHLAGGAMQARHLTRVAPSLAIIGIYKTASHLLSHLAGTSKKTLLNLQALEELLLSYGDLQEDKLIICLEKGFLEEFEKPLKQLEKKYPEQLAVYPSLAKGIAAFSTTIAKSIPEP